LEPKIKNKSNHLSPDTLNMSTGSALHAQRVMLETKAQMLSAREKLKSQRAANTHTHTRAADGAKVRAVTVVIRYPKSSEFGAFPHTRMHVLTHPQHPAIKPHNHRLHLQLHPLNLYICLRQISKMGIMRRKRRNSQNKTTDTQGRRFTAMPAPMPIPLPQILYYLHFSQN